jgi:hypothetical protein
MAVRHHLTSVTDFLRKQARQPSNKTQRPDLFLTETLASAHDLARSGCPDVALQWLREAHSYLFQSGNPDRGALHEMINAYEMHLRFAYGINP